MKLFRTLLLYYVQHRAFVATIAELRALGDAELAARNIDRADIVRIAFERAERDAERVVGRVPGGGRRERGGTVGAHSPAH